MDIIVDTNIYTSSSKKQSESQTARLSRNILDHIFEGGHNIVMSKELKNEYKTNYSNFGSEWYLNMALFGRIVDFDSTYDSQLRNELEYGICVLYIGNKEKTIICTQRVEKDIHLIELALVSGNAIISQESLFRNHIRTLKKVKEITSAIAKLSPIIWIIPTISPTFCEKWKIWLQNGDIGIKDWHLINWHT